MKYLILLITLSIICFSVEADTTEKKGPLTFPIISKIPVKVKHQYKMIENTTVSRTFDDGTTEEYKREFTYYVSFWAPGKRKDGFQRLTVQIDSLTYNYEDENEKISYYNSQDDVPPTHKPDFLKTFIPNALEFDMIYDAYGRVSKIEGGNLESQLQQLVDPKYGIKNDDYRLYTFQNRYSFEDISHIVDPIKGLIPPDPVAKDSLWKSEFNFDINYATFTGVVEPSMYMNIDNHFFIDFQTDSLKIAEPIYDLHRKSEIVEVTNSSAKGKVDFKISGQGIVKHLDTDFDAIIEGRFKRLKFIDKIDQNVRWELVGMWYL